MIDNIVSDRSLPPTQNVAIHHRAEIPIVSDRSLPPTQNVADSLGADAALYQTGACPQLKTTAPFSN